LFLAGSQADASDWNWKTLSREMFYDCAVYKRDQVSLTITPLGEIFYAGPAASGPRCSTSWDVVKLNFDKSIVATPVSFFSRGEFKVGKEFNSPNVVFYSQAQGRVFVNGGNFKALPIFFFRIRFIST
jgi:hypothetical protein